MNEVIFSKGDFTLMYRKGIGLHDTPWEGLEVKSAGDAEKHVVEVRLDTARYGNFEGTPVKFMYTNVYVSHGMRMKADTLEETLEYIEVLKQAVEFAREVKFYCKENGWWSE